MKKYLLAITGFLVGVILIAVFGIPLYQDWRNLKLETAQKETELKNRQDYSESVKTASEKLTQYKDSLDKINSSLPEQASLPSVMDFFQQASSQSGLVMKKIDLGEAYLPLPEEFILRQQKINFQIAGTYPSFKQFVSSLESSSRLIGIESISFTLPEKGEIFSFAVTAQINFLTGLNLNR